VASEKNALVHWIVIIESNKSETSRLVGVLVEYDLGLGHRSELAEVFREHLFSVVLAYTANIQPLCRNIRFVAVLVVSRNSPFRVNLLSIDDMGASGHG